MKKLVNKSKSTFEFEGFAPLKVKSHKGTFKDWKAYLTIEDNKIIALEGTAKTQSLSTKIEMLTSHLKAGKFLNTSTYPEIKFKSTSVSKDKIKGELTFLGVAKPISFQAIISPRSVEADFEINTHPFGLKSAGVQKKVRIKLKFSI